MDTRQKGRKLVLETIRIFKDEFNIECHETVGSGSGTREKGDIRIPALNLVIEAKKQKQVSMSKWAEQSEKEGLGFNKTALIWQIPKTPHIRADIDLCYFAELLKRAEEPKLKEPDRQLKWKIQKGVDILKSIIKDLE